MLKNGQIDRFVEIANRYGPAPDLWIMQTVNNRREVGIKRWRLMRAEHAKLEDNPGAGMLCLQLVGPGSIKLIMNILRAPNDGKLRVKFLCQYRRLAL